MLVLLSIMIFVCGSVLMCSRSSHLVSVFLGMEFMALGIFVIASMAPGSNSLFILLVLLCMAVSEAAVMLSFMVMVTRVYGSDRVSMVMIDKT
uniref:NADH-ubiquinone oxidoreductase chain 4L n=2 Tax=Modiolus TaxID=40255 RepID=A0A6M4RBC8_9BIVA|nr:NADH dehydrogenase subunit 4L [Modiolus nipponicus]QDO71926.1 NADH dehydrogenase subunit 4L [Modiolus nipponicus]QJS32946.1 NADH dehydrogenase subunit 4L [Modiolus comptus]